MQVAPTPEPLKETVLPDAVPRGLLDELRHFPHEDAGLGDLDGLGEDHLGLHFLHPLLQREAGFMGEAALFLFVGPCTGRSHRIPKVGERGGRGELPFHLVEPGDIGLLHPHGFRPRVPHDQQCEAVPGHDIHGEFFILFG